MRAQNLFVVFKPPLERITDLHHAASGFLKIVRIESTYRFIDSRTQDVK